MHSVRPVQNLPPRFAQERDYDKDIFDGRVERIPVPLSLSLALCLSLFRLSLIVCSSPKCPLTLLARLSLMGMVMPRCLGFKCPSTTVTEDCTSVEAYASVYLRIHGLSASKIMSLTCTLQNSSELSLSHLVARRFFPDAIHFLSRGSQSSP